MERFRRSLTLCWLPVWVIFLSLFLSSCSGEKQSTGQEKAGADYSAAWESEVKEYRSFGGVSFEIPLRLHNTGTNPWFSQGKNPCFLSYHLLDGSGKILRFDNPRTSFPRMISPGETVDIRVKVQTPLTKGKYILEFDLVREGLAWFADSGGAILRIPVGVEEQKWPEDDISLDLAYGRYTKFSSSVADFEMLRKLIRLTLLHDEVGWTGKTGKIDGFRAGSGYPQIWLRDGTTIIPASRYYYPENFLTSWLEEHLAFQKTDGSLEDWIDAQGRSDKNTVESDQETSAVQSAYQVFLLRGPDWLRKEISGEAVIDRLEKSLLFLFGERFDKKYGLIRGAHTADWGDVDMEDADQKAIYVDEKTHWTVDIYDQSMGFAACSNLAEMFASLGNRQKADDWIGKAETLKKRTNEQLWQEDKGFYRVHIHLDSLRHDFDEDEIFAMGGNAQAILSGLADDDKAARIIAQALARQKQFHISTISGSLLPPYPAGIFRHPAVDEPYEYQNGGQWDWFGGRLVYAMFENGASSEAKEKLQEIIRKDVANAGLFEWDTREGAGRGSAYYGGSAGSLAKALFEGYFGIKLERTSLSLEPRAGEDKAAVHAYLPAADIFAAYDYRPDRDEKKIILRYNSNFPHPGKIRMLLPQTFFELSRGEDATQKIAVFRDGQRIPFRFINIHEDNYIVLETDFKNHALEIKPAPLINAEMSGTTPVPATPAR